MPGPITHLPKFISERATVLEAAELIPRRQKLSGYYVIERLAKMVSLSEVVIRSDMNVARFVDQVKKDTTFYKAFKNLRVLGFTSWNDIRIKDKKGAVKAALLSKTKQLRSHGCRSNGNFIRENHW